MARNVTSAVILAAFAAIAVFAFLGNRWLGAAFIAVEASVLAHHAYRLCGRCSNVACGFNSRRNTLPEPPRLGYKGYSNLPITRTTVLPLLASYPFAVLAAWQFSPIATVAVGAVGLGAHSVFRELTCRHCGNDCLGNCNCDYKAWRADQRQAGG